MEDCEVWDVVRVPFPYTDRPVQQHRPALVVARHRLDGSPALAWVLMITSAAHRRWVGDIGISDLRMAGLPAPSVVRSAKIATIEATRADPIGHLPFPDRAAVRAELTGLLAPVLRAQP